MAKRRKVPAKQGGAGGKPPVEHQFKPGQSGNPDGRKPAGAFIREWINVFAQKGLTGKQLKRIARDEAAPMPKRAAAERFLRTIEAGDLSDFSGLLRGENNLEDLRGMGINTEVVKKFKQKTRRVPTGEGMSEEVIEREIELHDRAGNDFDRIMDRTTGKPVEDSATREPAMTDVRMVAIFVKYAVPEAKWPPGVLALYKAGKIQLPAETTGKE